MPGEEGGQAGNEQLPGEHQGHVADQAADQGGHEPPSPVDKVGVAGGDGGGSGDEGDEHRRLSPVQEPVIGGSDGDPVGGGGHGGDAYQDPERGHPGDHNGRPPAVTWTVADKLSGSSDGSRK